MFTDIYIPTEAELVAMSERLGIEIEICDGLQDYGRMLDYQRELFAANVAAKREGREVAERLIMLEHSPVVTLGRHAKESNVLVSEALLRQRGVGLYHIERGGDVTYHGPGQLVVYPLIDLEKHGLGVKAYVDLLEESVIRTIARFGIKGERVEGASGVWIGRSTPAERKICALGVKCSRHVTMHGLALNVNTDLEGFRLINPCGFMEKGVTSMAAECGAPLDFAAVRNVLAEELLRLLNRTGSPAPL